MDSLLELLKKSTTFLAQKGVENARLNAELIFAKTLNCRRFDLYVQFERLLTEAEKSILRERLVRRGRREPVQYILGDTDFRQLTLKCDARALIPRPETEELLDCVIEWLKPLLAAQPAPCSLLPTPLICDLGTGTGAIALSLAKELGASVTAVDFSAKALDLARENAELCGLGGNVKFVQSDWLSAFPQEPIFAAIIANPPYLTAEELATAAPEVRNFEPHSALVSGNAGMSDCEKILAQSRERLFAGGFVALETGIAQHEKLAAFARERGYSRTESLNDLSGRERFFVAWI